MLKNCTLIEAPQCKETDTVVEVAKQLREHLIRYIYVVDENQNPQGVISLTDINNRLVAEGKDPSTTTAKDIMTSPITTFEETIDIKEAYENCVKNNIATCPVTKEGKLVGMVTIHELLRKITAVE
jgi:CBS domain-containing protein